jgi:hypothetical protein
LVGVEVGEDVLDLAGEHGVVGGSHGGCMCMRPLPFCAGVGGRANPMSPLITEEADMLVMVMGSCSGLQS